jgi:hypothetical protein
MKHLFAAILIALALAQGLTATASAEPLRVPDPVSNLYDGTEGEDGSYFEADADDPEGVRVTWCNRGFWGHNTVVVGASPSWERQELCPDKVDRDGDRVPDIKDNCPGDHNPAQRDADGNGVGDACEPEGDLDGDGVPYASDTCPTVPNPGQEPEACAPEADTDDDGVPHARDNCPAVHNPDQRDSDGDGEGDACTPGRDDDEEEAR